MPIEWVSPDLERVVFRGDPIEELADGFGNENGPAEPTNMVAGGWIPRISSDQRQLFLPPNDNYFCLFSSCW